MLSRCHFQLHQGIDTFYCLVRCWHHYEPYKIKEWVQKPNTLPSSVVERCLLQALPQRVSKVLPCLHLPLYRSFDYEPLCGERRLPSLPGTSSISQSGDGFSVQSNMQLRSRIECENSKQVKEEKRDRKRREEGSRKNKAWLKRRTGHRGKYFSQNGSSHFAT